MQQKVTQYSTPYANPATTVAAKPPATNTTATPQYSNYDTALYSAASVYMQAQQAKGNPVPTKTTNWQQKKGTTFKRQKPTNTNKVQQVHYCDVCRISCAGPQTYREHLEGQKHKKREALQKATQEGQPATTAVARGSNLRCELCDVTCTGSDAYAAHVRGSKHQKVVKLHTKLGKPIPSAEPTAVVPPKDGKPAEETVESPTSEDIKPVGEEYIEEIKDAEGKVTTFNCKLCDCKFNDPNAKEMHTKGRRHRLQYKKKVQPDLVVDVKPTLRQRKMAEREKQRQQMQDDVWSRRGGDMEEEERLYWEQRRMEEECGGNEMPWGRGFPGMRRPMMGFPNFNNVRRIESLDDRHVITRHAEIYPKEDELQSIQRIVSHTERALKLVSDAMTEVKVIAAPETKTEEKMETQAGSSSNDGEKSTESEAKNSENKENGTQNQMISFQKDTEGTVRVLKGVMRVGLLAKGEKFTKNLVEIFK
jgi:zinc finger RNA-binding protein